MGGGGFDESADACLEVGGLGGEGLDAPREAAQGLFGGGELVEGGRRQAQRGAFCDLGGGGEAAELVAQVHRRADDEGFEFVDRRGARRLGASAGGFQRSQRLAAAPGARNGEVWASENLPRRPAGVEGVGLGAVAGRRGAGVAELDHLLAGRAEVRARSGPVAARALHGPGPRLARRVAVRPGE